MKKIKRILSSTLCLLLCLALLLLGAGCGPVERAAESAYSLPEDIEVLDTTCVAENSRYSLIWNAEKSCVILYDKVKDCEWSYIPEESLNSSYDYSEEGGGGTKSVHPNVKSPIIVQYYATANYVTFETNSYAMSIDKDACDVRTVENGLEMTCYFPDRELTVPVRFTLNEKGVDVSVDPTKIQENTLYNIYGITVAPFFCSVSNDNADSDDHYLFVPSGSGAIINPSVDDTRDAAIVLKEPVYGQDANITTFEEKTNTETVRIPVYGAVNGDKAMCAIIKDGAESAYVCTTIAQKLTGYSYICSELRIRGYQEVSQSLFTQTTIKTQLYSDAFTPDKVTVGFYPLYDEDASYVGMAETYRDYLNATGALSTEKSNDSLLNLKLVGGIETKEFHFGIPSTAMLTATTLTQAKNIVTDVKTRTGIDNINVNLIGFGDSGNDIGVVAGDYDINSAFGDEDDLKKLITYCNGNGLNLYYNFDMVRFSESGGGVTTSFGKADAANGSYTEQHYFTLNLRTKDTNLRTFYLVSRTQFSEVAANIKEAASDWKLPGISLDTLTSISYSDYSEEQYYARANFDAQSSAIINAFKNSGYKVAGSDANAFAAAHCTHVYDVPTQSSKYRYFTADVPFYQIVFKGSVSMSGSSLNLSADERTNLLKAVETGTGLTYTLIGEYDTNLITSAQNVFYGSVYWDNTIERGVRTSIENTVAEYKTYFDSVNGAKVADHRIISDNVRMTVFDNGVTVYVNYGDSDYTDSNVTVTAHGYSVKGA